MAAADICLHCKVWSAPHLPDCVNQLPSGQLPLKVIINSSTQTNVFLRMHCSILLRDSILAYNCLIGL